MPAGGTSRHGSWSRPGVPHRDWRCIDIEKAEELQTCEMCETAQVRWVHHMEHDDFPDVLLVGRVCAGKMEMDSRRADERERQARSRDSRRAKWLTRRWRTSERGNDWLMNKGRHVVVYDYGNAWRAVITLEDGTQTTDVRPTKDEAKLAAFDRLFPTVQIG